MKKIISIAVVMSFVLGINAFAFTDISGHWSEEYVNKMSEQSLINGYPDGTFLPDNAVTKAEFIKILCDVFGLPVKAGGNVFYDDVDGDDWYEPYLYTAMAIMTPDESGSFGGGEAITRIEAADAMLIVYGIEPDSRSASAYFMGDYVSYAADEAACAVISAALDNGIMQGKDGSFGPYDTLTRAELCTLVMRTVETKGMPDADTSTAINSLIELLIETLEN